MDEDYSDKFGLERVEEPALAAALCIKDTVLLILLDDCGCGGVMSLWNIHGPLLHSGALVSQG